MWRVQTYFQKQLRKYRSILLANRRRNFRRRPRGPPVSHFTNRLSYKLCNIFQRRPSTSSAKLSTQTNSITSYIFCPFIIFFIIQIHPCTNTLFNLFRNHCVLLMCGNSFSTLRLEACIRRKRASPPGWLTLACCYTPFSRTIHSI